MKVGHVKNESKRADELQVGDVIAVATRFGTMGMKVAEIEQIDHEVFVTYDVPSKQGQSWFGNEQVRVVLGQ